MARRRSGTCFKGCDSLTEEGSRRASFATVIFREIMVNQPLAQYFSCSPTTRNDNRETSTALW